MSSRVVPLDHLRGALGAALSGNLSRTGETVGRLPATPGISSWADVQRSQDQRAPKGEWGPCSHSAEDSPRSWVYSCPSSDSAASYRCQMFKICIWGDDCMATDAMFRRMDFLLPS